MSTRIEWTDATWNPVTGCTKVSAGCANCYAESVANRFWAKQYQKWATAPRYGELVARPFTDVQCHEDRLDQPLHWKKPRMVFVCSMGDLFHEAVPDSFIHRVWDVMESCEQHTFQVLTKRPKPMRDWVRLRYKDIPDDEGPLPNVWLGVSAENQATADERIPLLLDTPAAVRFVSCEPLLGPVKLGRACRGWVIEDGRFWIIVGGESGPGARPCDEEWIRSLVQQCEVEHVACFVKQLGSRSKRGRGKANDPETWPADLRVRQWPEVKSRAGVGEEVDP